MIVIYAIRCNLNGKIYIGCTAGKPEKRWREHRCLLRQGKHACKQLQADWITLGEKWFEFFPRVDTSQDESVKAKRALELYWMEQHAQAASLYNENRCSFRPPPEAPAMAAKARVANGYRPSSESNEKRRLAQLGKPKGHGAKISATSVPNEL